MTKQKLSILLLDGRTWEVEAEVVGDLALHADLKSKDPGRRAQAGLSITHVPTLMTFRAAVPWEGLQLKLLGPRAARTVLLAWMARVQEGMPKDWLAMRRLTAAGVRADPGYSAKVRERIRNHCLATKEVT